MFGNQIEKNKRQSFEYFVKVRKKQDINTIKVDNDKYSYITKRGKVRTYIGFNSFAAYKNSEFFPGKAEQVNTFWFVEMLENGVKKMKNKEIISENGKCTFAECKSMYTEEIKFFDLYKNLFLEDSFLKVDEMIEKVKKSNSSEALNEIINEYYRFGNCWCINTDNEGATKLECLDPCGNVCFLLVKKENTHENKDVANVIVVKCVEREISLLAVCDSLEFAYKEMAADVAKVLELPEVPSDWDAVEFARYDEFDVQVDNAWVNGKDNYDWKILSI